jgi:hypothetical protein
MFQPTKNNSNLALKTRQEAAGFVHTDNNSTLNAYTHIRMHIYIQIVHQRGTHMEPTRAGHMHQTILSCSDKKTSQSGQQLSVT